MGENASASDYVKNIDDKFTRALGHASKTVKKNQVVFETPKIKRGSKQFKEEYRHVSKIEEDLPPHDSELWTNPYETMEYFHAYLGEHFNIEDNEKNITCASREPTIDMWQLAATIPLLRVDELLVIAGTGTGKSWVMSQAARMFMIKQYLKQQSDPTDVVSRDPSHVIYVLRDDKAKQQQYVEFMKNPSIIGAAEKYFTESDKIKFRRGNSDPAQNPVVDMRFSPRRGLVKIVTFMSYAQGGNFLEIHGESAFNDAILIIDEIHEIQIAAEAAGATWKESVERFEKYLSNRMDSEDKGLLLALTATPYKSLDGFVRLMNYFSPIGTEPLLMEEFSEQEIDPVLGEQMKLCGIDRTFYNDISTDRLNGFRFVFYSIELSDQVYAQWFAQPEIIKIHVPTDRSEEDVSWIMGIANVKNNRYLAGHKNIGMDQKKKWTPRGLNWSGRQRSIAITTADYVNIKIQEDGIEKTIIFFPTDVGAKAFSKFISAYQPNIDVIYISNEDTKNDVETKKSMFDISDDNTMLVTNSDKFGTGHTFADPVMLSNGLSMGPKHIYYIQPSTYAGMIQIEGRARRRCLHAGWGDILPAIKRSIILPVATVDNQEMETCYSIMKQVTDLEKPFVESIDPAIFNASYTKHAFWSRRPLGLLYAEKEDLTPNKKYKIGKRKKQMNIWDIIAHYLGIS